MPQLNKKTMKKTLSIIALVLGLSTSISAQTAGTLTFSFTPVSKTSCYNGSGSSCQWVLASWITNSAGAFEQTTQKYCCNGSTSDHLPTWSVAAGGTAGNCSAANTTGATTGATLSGFTAAGPHKFTWAGKNKTGTLLPDGVYTLHFQETWNHGSSTATYTYSFTKGPNSDIQTPSTNATYQTAVSLKWIPTTTTGIEETVAGNMDITVYPNPNNTGIVSIDFEKADGIKVVNTLGVVVLDEKVEKGISTKNIDLSNLSNGIYFICVSDGENFSKHKVMLNK
jgi:hypothetical protein